MCELALDQKLTQQRPCSSPPGVLIEMVCVGRRIAGSSTAREADSDIRAFIGGVITA